MSLLAALLFAPQAEQLEALLNPPVAYVATDSSAEARELRPSLLVSFVGGEVAKDLAATIHALAEAKGPQRQGFVGLLPVEEVALGEGDSPCAILDERKVPTACDKLAPTLAKLNPTAGSERSLQVGQIIQIPKLDVTIRRSKRTFNREDRDAGGWRSLLNSWKGKFPQARAANGATILEFDAYDIKFEFSGDDQAELAAAAVEPLRSRNLLPHPPETMRAKPSVAFAKFPDDYPSICTGTPPTYHYAEMLDLDAGLDRIINPPSDPRSPPPPRARPIVYIIDTKVEPTPALAGALMGVTTSAPASWTCKWGSFVEPLHHGTHLAGIVASRNKLGFEGLAQTAQIRSFVWAEAKGDPRAPTLVASAGRDSRLEKLINYDESTKDALSVFLFTSTVKPYSADKLLDGQLADTDQRYNFPPFQAVKDAEPLLVVAAGQKEGAEPRRPITERTPITPQNLGDLENVIVVTACVECTQSVPSLLPVANYGVPPDPIVHIAAPGGEPIPAWIDGENIGGAPGTSQAAAFVAGVAAEMIARYSNSFGEAHLVKARLQLTAWPMLPKTTSSADPANGLASGIIDYQRALLDPRRDWFKLASANWQSDMVKTLPEVLKFTDDSGNVTYLNGADIGRLVQVPSLTGGPRFAVFIRSGQGSRSRGKVGRIGPLTLAQLDATVTFCQGGTAKLVNIEEIIFTATRPPDAQPC